MYETIWSQEMRVLSESPAGFRASNVESGCASSCVGGWAHETGSETTSATENWFLANGVRRYLRVLASSWRNGGRGRKGSDEETTKGSEGGVLERGIR